ncbi:hypothetical protein J2S14_001352 [Lederbergia wuyishanensis]|uniref:Uncharacterized protein n=1 Tax=Lederbergia wuyishanensis TaxID=1347903 RepID=A0ABU0D2D7_9BACI|nr:hypothetical protein [Lederbergia wuyishanensis]
MSGLASTKRELPEAQYNKKETCRSVRPGKATLAKSLLSALFREQPCIKYNKDNIIKFQSNRYSVPLGTYRPNGDNTVPTRIAGEELIIERIPGEEPLAVHRLSEAKGQLIKNIHHSRGRTKGIPTYMDTVKDSFKDEE